MWVYQRVSTTNSAFSQHKLRIQAFRPNWSGFWVWRMCISPRLNWSLFMNNGNQSTTALRSLIWPTKIVGFSNKAPDSTDKNAWTWWMMLSSRIRKTMKKDDVLCGKMMLNEHHDSQMRIALVGWVTPLSQWCIVDPNQLYLLVYDPI